VKRILTGDADRVLQCERTRAGNCARCGQEPSLHPDGRCPDGAGSFTWSHTRSERVAILRSLEAAIADAKERPRVPLTADQRALLDKIVEFSMQGKRATALSCAAALRWDVDRAEAVLRELLTLELIGRGIAKS